MSNSENTDPQPKGILILEGEELQEALASGRVVMGGAQGYHGSVSALLSMAAMATLIQSKHPTPTLKSALKSELLDPDEDLVYAGGSPHGNRHDRRASAAQQRRRGQK